MLLLRQVLVAVDQPRRLRNNTKHGFRCLAWVRTPASPLPSSHKYCNSLYISCCALKVIMMAVVQNKSQGWPLYTISNPPTNLGMCQIPPSVLTMPKFRMGLFLNSLPKHISKEHLFNVYTQVSIIFILGSTYNFLHDMWFIEATDWVAYLEVGSTLQGFNDSKVRGVVAEEEVEAILAVTQPGCHLCHFSLAP